MALAELLMNVFQDFSEIFLLLWFGLKFITHCILLKINIIKDQQGKYLNVKFWQMKMREFSIDFEIYCKI